MRLSLFADDEAFRRTAALMAFPHPDISGLHRSGRAPGIEQGTGIATAGELVLDRCEKRSIARKLERQSLIVFERFSDEFGQACRAEQAPGDTRRQGPAKGF